MKKNTTMILSAFLLIIILGSLVMLFNQQNQLIETDDVVGVDIELEAQRIFGSYIDIVARQVESRIESIFNELAILRDISQSYIDNAEELEPITDAMKGNPITADKLSYNGKWYQNTPDEPNVLMVHRHLLEENGEIKEEVQRDIDNTMILDLVLPSFNRNGVNKQLTYTQGGMDKSFTRMAPWVDLGNLFYEVYPAFVDTSIWKAFNPGLVPAFEKRMQEESDVQADPNKLARVLLPVQDGVTGEIVMTFTSPLFDENREQFRGTVAFDVTMTELIDLIEGLNFSKDGFSFLSQSSGNIFAVNEEGAEKLGFEEDLDSLEITGQGVGFNRLERILENSKYIDIQELQLPEGNKPIYEALNLGGESYVVVMQKLKPFQIWIANEWFKDESWVVGLVIPESEFIENQSELEASSDNEKNTGALYMLIIAITAVALFLLLYLNVNSTDQTNKN